MTLRSQSRENRSKDIYSESTGFATRPEPEVARPETEIAPVVGPSFGDIAAVSSRSQSVESGSEAGVEPQSGYPLPARQEPEITPDPFHPIANRPSFTLAATYGRRKHVRLPYMVIMSRNNLVSYRQVSLTNIILLRVRKLSRQTRQM